MIPTVAVIARFDGGMDGALLIGQGMLGSGSQ